MIPLPYFCFCFFHCNANRAFTQPLPPLSISGKQIIIRENERHTATEEDVYRMDIQKIISDLVSKLTGNKDLIASFTSDPLGSIKNLLGSDLDPSMLSDVVKGVTSGLGDLTGDAGQQASGILDRIKGLFGK